MSDWCKKCECNHPTTATMDDLYERLSDKQDRITTLESCLRQARTLIERSTEYRQGNPAFEQTLADIDKVLGERHE